MCLCRIWLFGAIVFGALLCSADAGQRVIGGDPWRDVQHTITARKLLSSDPELSAWNIGVIVRDRIAVLWGPVPSAEVAFRAEVRVRMMIELADVKNELYVAEGIEPLRVPLKIDNLPRYLPEMTPLKGQPRSNPAPAPAKVAPAPPVQVLPPEELPPGFDRKKLP